jgi:Cu/Ag efflux protein CusF
MKKCIIMFALFVATLLIAAWSNKDRNLDTKDSVVSKVDPSAKKLLVQDNTLKPRIRD